MASFDCNVLKQLKIVKFESRWGVEQNMQTLKHSNTQTQVEVPKTWTEQDCGESLKEVPANQVLVLMVVVMVVFILLVVIMVFFWQALVWL